MSDEIIKPDKDSAVEIHVNERERLGSTLIESLRRKAGDTGAALLEVATRKAENSFTAEVIQQVEMLVKHRNALFVALDKTDAEIKLTERRLAAIQAGEFKIEWGGKIQFNDVKLRM